MSDWEWEEDTWSLALHREDADCLKIFQCCWVRLLVWPSTILKSVTVESFMFHKYTKKKNKAKCLVDAVEMPL